MSADWMKPYLTFDPDDIFWMPHLTMMALVNSGHKIRLRDEMSRVYFENLVYLMVSQMDSEIIGAYGYMPIVYIAPLFDPDELRHVPQIVHDEFIHGNRIKDCLELIGFNADKWIEDHQDGYDYRLKPGAALVGRPTKDFRVNIFYYPIVHKGDPLTSWINFSIFQFLQDRGAGEQLKDAINSTFGPWAKENEKIMREENRHILHGDTWMAKLTNQHHQMVQELFNLWWPRSMATFGRPNSERNDLWRELGLKQRTNEQVLRDFLDGPNGIHAANKKVGLKIPPTAEVLLRWRKGKYQEIA